MEQHGLKPRKIKALSKTLKAIAQTRSISEAMKQLSTGGIVLEEYEYRDSPLYDNVWAQLKGSC